MDAILMGMAGELRQALERAGADPHNPPDHSSPPSEDAFREYRARGGTEYDDPDEFMQALIVEVGRDQ